MQDTEPGRIPGGRFRARPPPLLRARVCGPPRSEAGCTEPRSQACPRASAASHAPLLLRELTGLWVSTPLGAPGSCRRPTRRGQCLCRSRHCPFAMASNAWQRGSQCSNGHAKPATPGRRIDPPLSRAGSGVSQGSESLARPPGHGRGRPGCH